MVSGNAALVSLYIKWIIVQCLDGKAMHLAKIWGLSTFPVFRHFDSQKYFENILDFRRSKICWKFQKSTVIFKIFDICRKFRSNLGHFLDKMSIILSIMAPKKFDQNFRLLTENSRLSDGRKCCQKRPGFSSFYFRFSRLIFGKINRTSKILQEHTSLLAGAGAFGLIVFCHVNDVIHSVVEESLGLKVHDRF